MGRKKSSACDKKTYILWESDGAGKQLYRLNSRKEMDLFEGMREEKEREIEGTGKEG